MVGGPGDLLVCYEGFTGRREILMSRERHWRLTLQGEVEKMCLLMGRSH